MPTQIFLGSVHSNHVHRKCSARETLNMEDAKAAEIGGLADGFPIRFAFGSRRLVSARPKKIPLDFLTWWSTLGGTMRGQGSTPPVR